MKIKNKLLWRAKNALDSLFSKPVTGSVRHAIRRVVRPVRVELDSLVETQNELVKKHSGGKNKLEPDSPVLVHFQKEWDEVLGQEIELSLDGVGLEVADEMDLTLMEEDLLLEIGVFSESKKKQEKKK